MKTISQQCVGVRRMKSNRESRLISLILALLVTLLLGCASEGTPAPTDNTAHTGNPASLNGAEVQTSSTGLTKAGPTSLPSELPATSIDDHASLIPTTTPEGILRIAGNTGSASQADRDSGLDETVNPPHPKEVALSPNPSAPDASAGKSAITSVATDREALVALYHATDGPNWNASSDWGPQPRNWLTERPLDDWYGVTTNEAGRVTGIELSNISLLGTLPKELGNLSELVTLYFWGPGLTGQIPAELGKLTNLEELILGSTNLSGTIPPELGNLANLTELKLRGNAYTPPILEEPGNITESRSGEVEQAGIGLTGQIPPELGNLSNLKELALDENRLEGQIPPELGDLASLTHLSLEENALRGSIPPELGNLSKLVNLNLGLNYLTGPIPPELGNLSSLTDLRLSACRLSGELPPELGSLTNLEYMTLYDNQFTGQIPAEFGGLSNLKGMWLYKNDLSGPLPAELGNLFKLNNLYLLENRISGQISPEIGNLRALEVLVLGKNELSGPIPAELGNLLELEIMDLSFNSLTGPIPDEIGNLSSIQSLNLSSNELTGPLPRGLARAKRPLFLRIGKNNGLCVQPPVQDWSERATEEILVCRGSETVQGKVADRQILVAFFEATGGPDWSRSPNWLTSQPLDYWFGVDTDEEGNVTALFLDHNNLAGELPPSLSGLSHLSYLDLSGNHLPGTIPTELGQLTNLVYLDLGGSLLYGEVPRSLGNLENLQHLDIGGSHYSGSTNPNIEGTLPPDLVRLTKLTTLHYGGNPGLCAPAAMLDWLHTLNEVTGPVCPTEPGSPSLRPPSDPGIRSDWEVLVEFYNSTNGRYWTNHTNWLSHRPLSEWAGVTTDAAGRVAGWKLEGEGIEGTIPAAVGNLSHLTSLDFSRAGYFPGPIPPELGNLTKLTHLSLKGSGFSGPIPSELGNLSLLSFLDLSYNELTGRIPTELTGLSNLTYLILAGNKLNGHVPSQLGNLTQLMHLSLDDNDFVGQLPPELGQLTDLVYLELTFNELTGIIPLELANLTALEDLWFDYNAGLCAPPELRGWLEQVGYVSGPICAG